MAEFVRKDGTGQLNKNNYKTTDNHPIIEVMQLLMVNQKN